MSGMNFFIKKKSKLKFRARGAHIDHVSEAFVNDLRSIL